jgi:hypothetical protein
MQLRLLLIRSVVTRMPHASQVLAPSKAPIPAAAAAVPVPVAATAVAERPPILQGSYLTAAVQAKARAEREQQERQLLLAAAKAAKAGPVPASPGSSLGRPAAAVPPGSILEGSYSQKLKQQQQQQQGAGSGLTSSFQFQRLPEPDHSSSITLAPPVLPAKPSSPAVTPSRPQLAASRLPSPPISRSTSATLPTQPQQVPALQPAVPDSDRSFTLSSSVSPSVSPGQQPQGEASDEDEFLERPPAEEQQVVPAAEVMAQQQAQQDLQQQAQQELQQQAPAAKAPKRPPKILPPSNITTPAASVPVTPGTCGASPTAALTASAAPAGLQQPGSTTASRPVSAAGAGAAAALRRASSGYAGRATPLSAALKELAASPRAAKVELAAAARSTTPPRPLARQPSGSCTVAAAAAAHGLLQPMRSASPGRISPEEHKLLQSLARLDSQILQRGLAAAGMAPGAPPAPVAVAASSKAGGKGGRGDRGIAAGLTNSVQQDMLRDSIDRLDDRLAALRQQLAGEQWDMPEKALHCKLSRVLCPYALVVSCGWQC